MDSKEDDLNELIAAFQAKQAEFEAVDQELAELATAIQRILEAKGKRLRDSRAENSGAEG